MLSTQSTQRRIADLEARLDRALVGRVPKTDPAMVRCQFFLDLLREGVVQAGAGSVSPTVEDAISSLCRATDERDPLTTRRAIRDAGRTYAREATQDAVALPKQKRVFYASVGPGTAGISSEPASGVDL